jgi:acyl-coenzyme A thioesterase PaaI-like protein
VSDAPKGRAELPWRRLAGYHCFGCCADNPAGLALAPVVEGDGLACALTFDRRHESYPGIAHGGVAVAALDELMGNALALLDGKACFTVSLRTRFLSPLQIGRPYRVVARVVERPERPDGLFKLEGEILDAEGQAALAASATYCWMTAAQADAFMDPSPAGSREFIGYFRRGDEP